MNKNSIQPGPTVGMGDLRVAQGDTQMRTLLGSCVGVFLYDRTLRVGGLAHVVLPKSNGSDGMPGKFVDTAVPELISRLEACDVKRSRIRAKLVGGADMFQTGNSATVGAQNIAAAERELQKLKIPLTASHCGGQKGRRVTVEMSTGVVRIDVLGSATVEI